MAKILETDNFKIDRRTTGVLWRDEKGWHGCLKTRAEGETNFVGPYQSKPAARQALIEEAKRVGKRGG